MIFSGFRMLALGGFAAILAGGYWYYTKSQAQINTLQNQVAETSAAFEVQKRFISKQADVIDNMSQNIELIQSIQNDLVTQQRANKEEVDNLQTKFRENAAGNSRDIGVLAAAKPGLIENVINKATAEVGKEIEELTK